MSGVGDAITSVVNTVGSVLQPIAEVGLPILETAIGQPELILPTEAAFGGLNLGEGIGQGKPFGQIAEQLGLETAGAAVGGGAGDFLDSAGGFFGGAGDAAVAPGADAVTSGATGGLDAAV